jgi:malate dehydrogenase (oxaloacetate-decarboxylating)
MLRRLPLPKLRSPSAAASLQTPRRFAYQKATPSNSSNDDSAGHPSNPSDDPKLSPLYTPLTGRHLLEEPMLNKGAAFTFEERERFKLMHFLPHEYHRLETQLSRAEAQLRSRKDPLAKYSFLRSMKDQNQVLFYALIQKNLKECLPIIYTVSYANRRGFQFWHPS